MDYHRRAVSLLLILVGFILSSCSDKKAQVTRSYYYWRSDFITDYERKFLRDHEVSKLYVRLLDIDWNEVYGAIPVATGPPDEVNYRLNYYDSLRVNIVPVIFITNKTFERIDSFDIPLLAKRVVRRCLPSYDEEDQRYESQNPSWGRRIDPNEIQIDCDWTAGTRNKYFYFLQQVKELVAADSIFISATIRLHQYKYPDKTGVPPVARGMLMMYNISDLRQHSSVNSIYDNKKAKEYFTTGKKYSLPLDVVLPAYSWCIVFRNQKFYQIENGLSEKELKELSFLSKMDNGFYRVKQDTVFRSLFLRPGDEIKAETINEKTLQQAADLAKKAVNADQFSVAFFELSETEINNYSHETIENIYHSYQ